MAKIASLNELQKLMPRLLRDIGDNHSLALTALANPLVALEKLGYSFTPSAKKEIENHVRFGKKTALRKKELEEDLFRISGATFNFNDPSELKLHLSEVLSKKTSLSVSGTAKSATKTQAILNALDKPFAIVKNKIADPLESFEDVHPIFTPLLQLRKIETTHSRLADEETLEKINRSKTKYPFTNIRFRLSRK